MKVWWCERHKNGFEDDLTITPVLCAWAAVLLMKSIPPEGGHPTLEACRFSPEPMQLVPADARIVSEATVEELIAELRNRGTDGVVRIEYIGPPGEPFYVETP